MRTLEEKVNMVKALDTGLAITESSGTKLGKHDKSIISRNDTDIEEQHHVEQPEFNNEGGVDHDAEQYQDKHHLLVLSNED
ncbi:hypothetical protein Tco_0379693 [Tanacetum coccineum]